MPPTLEQRVAHSKKMSARYHARKAQGIVPVRRKPKPCTQEPQQELIQRAMQAATRPALAPQYDPHLLAPCHVARTPPPPACAATERARLESELKSLRREQAATQRGIYHLLNQLGQL